VESKTVTIKYYLNKVRLRLRDKTFYPYTLFIKVTYFNKLYTLERYTLSGEPLSKVVTPSFIEEGLVDCSELNDKYIKRIQMYSLFEIEEIIELA